VTLVSFIHSLFQCLEEAAGSGGSCKPKTQLMGTQDYNVPKLMRVETLIIRLTIFWCVLVCFFKHRDRFHCKGNKYREPETYLGNTFYVFRQLTKTTTTQRTEQTPHWKSHLLGFHKGHINPIETGLAAP